MDGEVDRVGQGKEGREDKSNEHGPYTFPGGHGGVYRAKRQLHWVEGKKKKKGRNKKKRARFKGIPSYVIVSAEAKDGVMVVDGR